MDFVIGIGNTLRTDDGVAAQVIAALPSMPNIAAITVHQLTPEIALRLCDAERVLFIDAHYTNRDIAVKQVFPAAEPNVTGHSLSPQELLGLTQVLCSRTPQAWLLSIPGYDFGFGETLSEQTRARLPEAISATVRWMKGVTDQGGTSE